MTQQLSTDFDIQLFAMNNYIDYRKSTVKEFRQDFGRLSIICKLLEKWKLGKTDSIHLVVNHIIIFFNVFELHAAALLLFLKAQPDIWQEIKTVLLFLNRLPVIIPELDINTLEIPINKDLMNILENL